MNVPQIDVRAVPSPCNLLHRGAHVAAGTVILEAHAVEISRSTEPVEEGIGGGEQVPFEERIGLLYCAAILLFLAFLHRRRRKRCAAKSAAIRGLPHDDDLVPLLRRFFRDFAMNHLILPDDANCSSIHEAAAVIARVEHRVSSEVWDAQRVPVACDTPRHFPSNRAGFFGLQISESEHVEAADDPGAHAHNVADDTPNARRGAFVRHDLTWVIMGFMRDDDSPALPLRTVGDRDDAAILPGAEDHVLSLRGKHLEEASRGLVGTVLRALHPPDRCFRESGIAAEHRADFLRLFHR